MMMDNEPRMQDRSPEGQMFAIESEIKNMMKEYEMAVRNGENQRAQMIADQVGKLEEMKIEIQETTRPRQIDNIKSILNAGTLGMTPGKDMGGRPVNMDANTVRQNQMEMGDLSRFGMASGGEASFPDLTGDGQVTQADILKGRGVEFAEGGEAIGDDLAGMAMSEEEAMAEVGNAEKEMAMIQQLVTVVQQLLAEGISEDDLVAFLKEQGLDDEDIDSLMQMVLQSQSTQAPDQIGQELQGMM